MKPATVVFAYHNIGVIGIDCLLQAGFDIRLVVTHRDNAGENIWFDSVAELAEKHAIAVLMPDDPNQPEIIAALQKIAPQWLFSFYYRQLLSEQILAIPERGAYNLHGSLLPKYRGRAPVNWAVLHGEPETGVTLHQMEAKPDAGAVVDRQAVAIDDNDTAHDVFLKLAPAARTLLQRCLPKMLAGDFSLQPLDLDQGNYFGGRTAADGRIDWTRSAWEIHNLVRAVAPPYPGAFFACQGHRVFLLGSYYNGEVAANSQGKVCIYCENGQFYADCADGKRFRILQLAVAGKNLLPEDFHRLFGEQLVVQ